MVNMEGYESKGFIYLWKIKNFNFCWHKTGEHLESPLLRIDTPYETSWRLWLYPRGEDDGEYISYYLFRDEGGPAAVNVDFELYLLVDDILLKKGVIFSEIYSFKCYQREGLKCFETRRRVFSPMAAKNDRFTLTVGCRILHVDKSSPDPVVFFQETTVIAAHSIPGIEVLDFNSSLSPEITKNIEVKPLLEEETLLNINVSYLEKYLAVNIRPKSFKKIRYAVLKISVFQHWLNESPIEHIRTWIGEIETDIWKFYVPQVESVAPGVVPGDRKSFLLRYDFVFSTGDSLTEKEEPIFNILEWKTANLSGTKFSSPSALSALQEIHGSRSYIDLNIVTKTGSIFAHKAFLSARSSKLMSLLPINTRIFQFRATRHEITEKFFSFLYTDTLGDVPLYDAQDMHTLSDAFKIEILKAECTICLKRNLDIHNASLILNWAENGHNSPLKNFVINYIISYSEDIFPSSEWITFLNSKPELSKQVMLLKYKRPGFLL